MVEGGLDVGGGGNTTGADAPTADIMAIEEIALFGTELSRSTSYFELE